MNTKSKPIIFKINIIENQLGEKEFVPYVKKKRLFFTQWNTIGSYHYHYPTREECIKLIDKYAKNERASTWIVISEEIIKA